MSIVNNTSDIKEPGLRSNTNVSDIKENATNNAVNIENALTKYITTNLNNTVYIDNGIQEIVATLLDKLPDMSTNELTSTLRTLSSLKSSASSQILNTLTTENSSSILDKLRDREVSENQQFDEVFKSTKNNSSNILNGLMKLSELLGSNNPGLDNTQK